MPPIPTKTPPQPKVTANTNGQAKKKPDGSRKVVYERISVLLRDGQRDEVLTEEMAKAILGWISESEVEKFGSDYLFRDENGVKVRCLNNPDNRPYKEENAQKYKQEILRDRWRLNGEVMIVGNTGSCLSCQHRLIGFIKAVQEWRKNPLAYPEWKDEPTLKCIIILGVDESDDVVNTIDTGAPRTLADVIYRTGYFSKYSRNQREQASKILENGVKFLWDRTGEVWNPYSPYRTHAEMLALIDRFPRIVDCVDHIYQENGGSKKRIAELLPLGISSGLLYIMGSSATDANKYQRNKFKEEKSLDWERWQQACDFWVLIAGHAKPVTPLIKALGQLNAEGAGGGKREKTALVIKAWDCVVNNRPITAKELALKYNETGEGIRTLAENPQLGGIDNPERPEAPQEQEENGEQ